MTYFEVRVTTGWSGSGVNSCYGRGMLSDIGTCPELLVDQNVWCYCCCEALTAVGVTLRRTYTGTTGDLLVKYWQCTPGYVL